MLAIWASVCAACAALGWLAAAIAFRRRAARERGRLESVVAGLSDGIVVTDLSGEVLCCNETARAILDSQQGQDLRMRVQEVLKRRTQTEVLDAAVGEARGRFHTTVKLFSGRDGRDLGVLIVLRPQPQKS